MDIEILYDIFKKHPKISTDSRKIDQGSLFFALHGANFNGNSFAASALDQGAAYAVVDDPSVAVSERYIVVDDTLKALQQLAAYHRKELAIPVLAITGSNGKTTTKELVSRVLACKFKVAVTQGNLNNHIGVPLTILNIDRSCEFAVIEMGASARKEIELLSNIAAPDYGLITNIGRAHLEGFGGGDGIREGKGELFDYLERHRGTAFYLADDPILSEMVDQRKGLIGVGYSSKGDLPASRLVGDYNRFNIAAAVAIGGYFGVDAEQIAEAVWSYKPDNNRSQRVSTERNELIVDCYNANPSSMSASIGNFMAESFSKDGRNYEKWAILGDMLELGEFAADEHTAILRQLEGGDITDLYLVGAHFCDAATRVEAPSYRLHSFANRNDLKTLLHNQRPLHKFILIKGSRGIGLEAIIDIL